MKRSSGWLFGVVGVTMMLTGLHPFACSPSIPSTSIQVPGMPRRYYDFTVERVDSGGDTARFVLAGIGAVAMFIGAVLLFRPVSDQRSD